LIIADSVNPHRLSNADLTQQPDQEPALTIEDSGMNIDTVTSVIRTVLFVTDLGVPMLLGDVLQRSGRSGMVVAWQPG
jgi:hypothetical protein